MTGPVRLSVRGLRTAMWPQHEVSFDLRAGEITGMAGLVGAGRSEIARAVFGVDRPLAGTVSVNGNLLLPGNPRASIAAGVAFAPEDRKEQGVILEMAIRDNIALPGLHRMARTGFIDDRAVTAQAESMQQTLSIRTPSVLKAAGQLSGGNQQKVVLAKWLALKPTVFLLDEPTRGVDVGSKREIYEVIESLASSGAAVLVISSDLEEVLRLSDRVLVMHEGRPAGELPNTSLSEESIMSLATGRPAA
jgi:ABC-type sugar transport system ATPase subunit